MASKRALGVSYFLGLGFGLLVSLGGYFVLVDPTAGIVSVGALSALAFASTLPFVGYWLHQSDLSEAEVWTIARWCAGGLAVPTILVGGFMISGIQPRVTLRFPHVWVNLIAAGGVVGSLLGLIRELRRQYTRVDALNQRNQVLNQLLRHDIKNDVAVIDGYAERIAQETEAVDEELLRPIQRKSREIHQTSQLAQHVQELDDDTKEPVDAVSIVTDCLNSARESHPDSDITMSLPDHAWVEAGELLRTVIDNLVENAVEHADRSPRVALTIESAEEGWVTIRIADNGPGLPDHAREVLTAESPPSATESASLGVWLIRWVSDHYDGRLTVKANEPRGTSIELQLPEADPPSKDAPDTMDD